MARGTVAWLNPSIESAWRAETPGQLQFRKKRLLNREATPDPVAGGTPGQLQFRKKGPEPRGGSRTRLAQ
jgi:hypothetical protein